MSDGHSRRSISVRVWGWPTSRCGSLADVVEHVQSSAMASRITSGARLCVRASFDRLVCNLSRSSHHNAVASGVETAAVRRGSDRLLQCYQVSTLLSAYFVRGFRLRSCQASKVAVQCCRPSQGLFNDFARQELYFAFGNVPCDERSWPRSACANI